MADLTRLGISMTKDGAKRLGELATTCETSQSGLVESVIWFLSSDADTLRRVRNFIKDAEKAEQELISLARSNPGEAKKLLARVKD